MASDRRNARYSHGACLWPARSPEYRKAEDEQDDEDDHEDVEQDARDVRACGCYVGEAEQGRQRSVLPGTRDDAANGHQLRSEQQSPRPRLRLPPKL